MKAKLLESPEASEIAKLTETTYFGLMIAWAQEIERYCAQYRYLEPTISFRPFAGHCAVEHAYAEKSWPGQLAR